MIRLSIVVPVLNSHEIVRRQVLYFKRMNISDDVEIIYVDDGSEPPLQSAGYDLKNFRIIPTYDKRPWTWAIARNKGIKESQGEYILLADLDYIIPAESIEFGRRFDGQYVGFRREFGVLDENGVLTQDIDVLVTYGFQKERFARREFRMPAHPNHFIIKKEIFQEMGGYREDLVGREYPQGEDNAWKQKRKRWEAAGKLKIDERRPLLYMFPNGKWSGDGTDVDYNPFGLFHNLSRKSERNPWHHGK